MSDTQDKEKNGMRKAWEVLSYVSCIVLGCVLLWLFYRYVVLQAPRAVDATATGADVLMKLGPRTAVAIIVTMIALLAFVFWLFISFGRRLSVRGYLGPLTKDAIARAEIARREAILDEERDSDRIEPELEPHSDEFKKRYRIPLDEAPQYGYHWGPRLPGLTGVGALGGSTPPPGVYVPPISPDDDASQSQLKAWLAERAERTQRAEMQNWGPEKLREERDANLANPADKLEERESKLSKLNAIRAEISRRFQEGNRQERLNAYNRRRLEIAAEETERAEELLPTIDISFLGGGWVFVLEFTTIIFIVFAVLALGLLGVLNSEAIAAILAAIAGYVLGKSTSTRGAGSEETRRGGEEPKAQSEVRTSREEIGAARDKGASKVA